mgnify:CR=1 FL=1
MKKEITRVEIDLKKIFLTPPNNRREKITLLVMMVALFVMFFGPICFTDVHPVKAILLSCLPCPSPGGSPAGGGGTPRNKSFHRPHQQRQEDSILLALLFFVSKTGLSSKYLDIFYNANRNWQTKTDKFDILLIGGGKNVEIKKCM